MDGSITDRIKLILSTTMHIPERSLTGWRDYFIGKRGVLWSIRDADGREVAIVKGRLDCTPNEECLIDAEARAIAAAPKAIGLLGEAVVEIERLEAMLVPYLVAEVRSSAFSCGGWLDTNSLRVWSMAFGRAVKELERMGRIERHETRPNLVRIVERPEVVVEALEQPLEEGVA